MVAELGVPEEIKNQILTPAGELVPGFSGIGMLRGRTDYSENEKTILQHFFTNTRSNVYCATDHMPNELWALVMGQYARSGLTARERLLQLFSDMHEKNFEGAHSIDEIARQIRLQGDVSNLDVYLKAAGKFIETWGIQYGHASLRDSGTIRICFEGVSQRATKELELAREGAYQEQSTRALPFEAKFLGMPYELRGTEFEVPLQQLNLKLISFYEKLNDAVKVHVANKFAGLRTEADEKIASELGTNEHGITDKQWDGILSAKAFDVARYMLPQNMTTSLGLTLNTRRFLDMLTEWQSSPLLEMRVLGLAAQVEAKKISPELMKYGTPSEFRTELPERGEILLSLVDAGPPMEYKHREVESRFLEATPNLEDWALASILFNSSDGARSIVAYKNAVSRLSREERRRIAASQFLGKKPHEIYPKKMEIGSVMFERTYDIGAFRDLQRQRGDRQQKHRYAVVGFHMPSEVGEVGFEKEFFQLMNEVRDFSQKLIQAGHRTAAEYVPVMANTIRHVTTKDPVQMMYEAQLRTVPAGIDSYRLIIQQETEQVLQLMPSFRGLVDVDNNYYPLGRLDEAVKGNIRKHKKN